MKFPPSLFGEILPFGKLADEPMARRVSAGLSLFGVA
jgi:hypothetical protein